MSHVTVAAALCGGGCYPTLPRRPPSCVRWTRRTGRWLPRSTPCSSCRRACRQSGARACAARRRATRRRCSASSTARSRCSNPNPNPNPSPTLNLNPNLSPNPNPNPNQGAVAARALFERRQRREARLHQPARRRQGAPLRVGGHGRLKGGNAEGRGAGDASGSRIEYAWVSTRASRAKTVARGGTRQQQTSIHS